MRSQIADPGLPGAPREDPVLAAAIPVLVAAPAARPSRAKDHAEVRRPAIDSATESGALPVPSPRAAKPAKRAARSSSAVAIMGRRDELGRFRSIEDVASVGGVGRARLARIADHVGVRIHRKDKAR